MENFIFSFNTIAPIFAIVALGALLKRKRFAGNDFFVICDKLGFKICLPYLLFLDIAEASFEDIDGRLLWFCAGFVTIMFLGAILLVPLFEKKNEDRGVMIQGMCRSNAAILGVTIAASLFGQEGSVMMAASLPVVIALYNVYSVIVLSIFAPKEAKLSSSELFKKVVKNIVTNPLILAVLLAVTWNLTGFTMPVFFSRSLNYLSDICVPLALLSLGASFSVQALQESAGKAIISSLVKTILIPFVGILAAYLMGFREVSIGIILVIFGGPTAISSYTMARQMKSNHVLAGEIVLISTFMSAFTLFLGIFILRLLGMI